MKNIFYILFFSLTLNNYSQQLPKGVTMDTISCTYANGLSSHNFYKNNELIGNVIPSDCFYSETQGGRVNPICFAEFYMTQVKDTFNRKKDAMNWIITKMEDYYKPTEILKWKSLLVRTPNAKLKYPADWNYKLSKYDGVFKSKTLAENKLTLLVDKNGGQSEILILIRTPNTAKLSVEQVMEINAQMNRAIDFKTFPSIDFNIGGKTFKYSENTFMMQMQQFHFWYADTNEIIYINYNLLKDEKDMYPEVMKTIVNSIKW